MNRQSYSSSGLEKYFGIFIEGMIEIIAVTVISVTIIGFEDAFKNLSSVDPGLIVKYRAVVFIASVFVNFIKGFFWSLEAAISIMGMLIGLWLFGGPIVSIASDAIIEVIIYIIAALVGIYIGFYFRGRRQNQEYMY